MFIVRIIRNDGTLRYVLIDTGGTGGTSEAREIAQARLGPGEIADMTHPASEYGLALFRAEDGTFRLRYGENTSINDVISRLQGGGEEFKMAETGGAAQPGDPLSAETGVAGTGVAFRRALESIPGMAPFRGVGRDLQSPLSNIFDIGGLAGLKEGPFAGLGAPGREEFAVGDFFRNALDALQRGTSTIGGLASQAFNAPENLLTSRFLNPSFGLATGAEGESATTRLRNAEEFAQLARLAARRQFGTVLARRLAGPQQLVEQYRAQPLDTAEEDFRTFLQSRTSR